MDTMTAPRFADCRCGHAKAEHEREGFKPQCVAARCTCIQYVPATANTPLRPLTPARAHTPAPTPTVSNASGPTVEQILAAGKRSTRVATRRAAERIEKHVADLRARLTEERVVAERKAREEAAKEQAKREVAELEAKLADARAKLRAQSKPKAPKVASAPKPKGDGICPDCGKDGLTAVGPHRAKAHGYRRTEQAS